MVISGKVRGNAPQLANYLLKIGDNDRITILDVDGMHHAGPSYLKDTLYSMELNSELTRSDNSVYHAFINPNPTENEDRLMTAEEWHRSADILAQHLNLEQQRRVIVLHEKKGRIHAHVVFERYDHERGVMIDYKQNYKAHDKARFQMENEFGHRPTPQKNQDKLSHKKTLTEIWKQTKTGEHFIKEAYKNGYQIAKGTNRPFRVVDENGVSFDLVRQLDGVKTKEVLQRLCDEKLIEDKKAISHMNALKKEKQVSSQFQEQPSIQEAKTNKETLQEQTASLVTDSRQPQAIALPTELTLIEIDRKRQEFIDNLKAEKERNQQRNNWTRDIVIWALLALRVTFSYKQTPVQIAKTALQQFITNKTVITNNATRNNSVVLNFTEASHFYKSTEKLTLYTRKNESVGTTIRWLYPDMG